MDRSLKVRSLILVGILLACVVIVLPTFVGGKDKLPGFVPDLFRADEIQLGLDLQGGSHIVYNIDLDKAIDDKASEIRRDV